MILKIIIFDMNKLKVEIDKEYELLEFLKEEVDLNNYTKQCNEHLKILGLRFCGLKINLINSNKFIWHVINKLFKDFEIIRTNGIEAGHPDYILQKGEEKIYLELKVGKDSLRTSQLKWFIKNKDKNNKILVIDWDEDFSPKNDSGDI